MRVADRFLQTPFHLFPAEKALPRQNEWIDQLQQTPAVLHFAGQPFHKETVVTKSPDRADVSAHAAAGDDVEFDSILFQHLDNSNVRQTARSARGEGQT